MSQKIKVGITHGDINGIGYEVIIKTFDNEDMMTVCTPIIYGSPKVLAYHKKIINEGPNFNVIAKPEMAKEAQLNIIDCFNDSDLKVEIGTPTEEAGKAAFIALERGVQDLKNGLVDALVTAPINKNTIQNNDFHFPGHTEYIEEKAGNGNKALMILMNNDLRVALVTTHLPVAKIAQNINQKDIENKIGILLHNESMIHSLVLYNNGVYRLDHGKPDMRIPIKYALFEGLTDFKTVVVNDYHVYKDYHFRPFDIKRYPIVKWAKFIIENKGTYGAVFNASNEVAVHAFLKDEIPFLMIEEIINHFMKNHQNIKNPSLEQLIQVDKEIRKETRDYIERSKR